MRDSPQDRHRVAERRTGSPQNGQWRLASGEDMALFRVARRASLLLLLRIVPGGQQAEEPMAADPRKRQKKQERRAAKQKEKKQLQVREQSAGVAGRLAAAARFPVLHCWITDSLEGEGIGWVVLSRELPGGWIAVASFLVDRYCLGVKDAFARVVGRSTYEHEYVRRMHREMSARIVPPAEARKLLEQAMAYARKIGFPPHAGYAKAVRLFGSIDPAESSATFEFGKDGKPFYIAGPNDSLERSRQIVAILNNTCGPEQFEYLIPLHDPISGSPLPGAAPLIGRIKERSEEPPDEADDLDEPE
jgi:hypothetical protein